MAGMELLQFHTLLYSALEEVNAEYDARHFYPGKNRPTYLLKRGIFWGRAEGPSVDFGKVKSFISYRDS